jgi:predicted ATPase
MPTSTLVVLTGAPGTGKTAILDRLGSDIHRVPEPAREILAEQRATAGTATPESDATRFVDLLLRRSVEHHRAAGRTEGPVIFDRGIPDCVAYAVVLGVDPAPSIEAAERYRYRSEVLIVEPWEDIYTVDDERTMSFADTVAFHEAIREAYEAAGYALVDVPRGAIDERATFVRDLVTRPRGSALQGPG